MIEARPYFQTGAKENMGWEVKIQLALLLFQTNGVISYISISFINIGITSVTNATRCYKTYGSSSAVVTRAVSDNCAVSYRLR